MCTFILAVYKRSWETDGLLSNQGGDYREKLQKELPAGKSLAEEKLLK